MNRERLIPLLLLVAVALDYLFPVVAPGTVTGAWLVPALMLGAALAKAIKGKRDDKNSASAESYKAERQNAVDRYEASLSKAKRGERLRFGNALARSRGFAVPEFDATASEGVNLDLPAIPKYKSGGLIDLLGAGAEGLAGGLKAEAQLNAERGSLPEGAGEEAGPPSSMIEGGPLPSAVPSSSPSSVSNLSTGVSGAGGADPYAALLGRTPYFSNLAPRR